MGHVRAVGGHCVLGSLSGSVCVLSVASGDSDPLAWDSAPLAFGAGEVCVVGKGTSCALQAVWQQPWRLPTRCQEYPLRPPPRWMTISVSRHCQMSLAGRIALVENHCLSRKGMPGKQRVALNLLGLELLFECLVY